MTKKLGYEGDIIPFTAGAAYSSGDLVQIGTAGNASGIAGVVQNDVANGAVGQAAIRGRYTVPKLSTDVIAAGDWLWLDGPNKRLQKTSTGLTPAARAVAAAGNGVLTVDVILGK